MDVVDRIHRAALETPERPAIIHNLTSISYRRFYLSITAMRRQLAAHSLQPGGVAVLWIDDLLVSWVADLALRADGHTTLSVRSGPEVEGVGELDVVAIVTLGREGRLVEDYALPAAPRIVVAELDLADDGDPEPPPAGPAGGHILLTSATTGRYKMVPLDAAREAMTVKVGQQMMAQHLEQSGRPVTIALFDFGLWTVMGYVAAITAWSMGQTAAFHQGPDKYALLTLPGLTHASVTPALLEELMAAPEGAFPRNDELEIRLVAGALSELLFRRTTQRLTTRIVTSVGSTEAGSLARTEVKSAEDLRWHRLNPDAAIELVDENDRLVAAGQVGQIRVPIGEDISRYLNDADATAASFKDGHFYPGDLAVLDGAGRIALLGRVTDVIPLNGDKLPAAPFETAMQGALGREVCLLSEQGADRGEHLHVVVETPTPIDAATLRAAAAEHLAAFATIHFHFVAALPRNHMGKVERFKLRQTLVTRR